MKQFLLAACGIVLVLGNVATQAQSAAAASTASTASQVTQFTLANGMTVIVKPDKRAPTAVQMVWVRVGSMDEVDGTSGVAHVLEHMLFKGTASLKPGEFSRKVAALGGRENAFTTRDYTGYYQQIPSQRLADVMRLEADRFANNQWPDEEFKKELEVVKEERRMRTEDSPRALMMEAMNATIYQASPYRRPVVGWMNDLDAMTPNDAREFYQRWYVPANATLVVAGDVDVAQVRALAEQTYGRIAARPVPTRKPRVEPVQAGIRRIEFKAPDRMREVQSRMRRKELDKRREGQSGAPDLHDHSRVRVPRGISANRCTGPSFVPADRRPRTAEPDRPTTWSSPQKLARGPQYEAVRRPHCRTNSEFPLRLPARLPPGAVR